MASSKAVYDVIVIGAGIEGSATAYNLSKEGKRVLLLEQFPLPHSRGSSHGQSRITRYAYENEFYVRMMVDAFPMWAELEKESGAELFINCGVVDLRTEDSPGLKRLMSSMRAYNIPHENLAAKEIRHRFPTINVGEKDAAIWDPSGGLLRADKALRAFQDIFKQHGGIIHDTETVTSVTPGPLIVVSTSRSVYTSHNVVLAAGPWSGRLCSSLGIELPLQPIRIAVFYWKAAEEYTKTYGTKNFPCFIDSRGNSNVFHTYGLPMSEYPGLVKVCPHQGPDIDPDKRDKGTDDAWAEEATNTPDRHPFIDRHPKYPNVIIAAGFSGHGFKLAPAVGKAITELIMKKRPTYNMEPFKVDRFQPKSNL